MRSQNAYIDWMSRKEAAWMWNLSEHQPNRHRDTCLRSQKIRLIERKAYLNVKELWRRKTQSTMVSLILAVTVRLLEGCRESAGNEEQINVRLSCIARSIWIMCMHILTHWCLIVNNFDVFVKIVVTIFSNKAVEFCVLAKIVLTNFDAYENKKYIDAHIHTRVWHTQTYNTHTHTHTHKQTQTQTHTHTRTHSHTRTHTRTHIHINTTHTHRHTRNTHAYTHTQHIHTYTQHIHTWINNRWQLLAQSSDLLKQAHIFFLNLQTFKNRNIKFLNKNNNQTSVLFHHRSVFDVFLTLPFIFS